MNKPDLSLAGTDKDAPLREDIRRLGRLLGDTIRAQEGETTFELVENIRQLAVTYRRDSDHRRKQELESALTHPVLTAHPTEVQRKSVLDAQRAVARILNDQDRVALTPQEWKESEEELKRLILTLWQTSEIRSFRLRVIDEIENGLSYYQYPFLTELPRLYAELEDTLGCARSELPPFFRIGSWIGGDRDGNPYVTHDVTQSAMERHSAVILAHYLNETHVLGGELSLSDRLVQFSPALTALADAAPDRSASRAEEPYS